MSGLNRRDIARLGATLAAGFALSPLAAEVAGPLGDPLALVDPELRAAAAEMLATSAQFQLPSEKTLPQMRAGMARYEKPLLVDVPVAERRIPGPQGAPDVRLYVINARRGGVRPAVLHTHGGGFIMGTAKIGVRDLQELSTALDCTVVTVDYRLAPESRYADSIEDNYAGLKWLHANAGELGVDRRRIAVMGESAGGGHAALLAITARDRGEVPLLFQALVYPMLDDRTGTTRAVPTQIGKLGWNAEANRFGWRSFLGQALGGANVPARAVPARTADLAGLPPAWIGVGALDLFVSEDMEYARRLIDAAVPTELVVVPGAFHGFDMIASGAGVAKRFTEAKLNALRRAFAVS
ncbi:alpha/beta hydrolase [Sphingomonas tabacisoli]|uniref:Alpha/beta hydrolase n=1 Tax=Sphingomonas tabacisoli TaxID=2249466 RepID=A0ABW4I534_9SPHN